MTSTFQCEYCQCFTFKRCDKFKLKCTSHGGMYSAHYLYLDLTVNCARFDFSSWYVMCQLFINYVIEAIYFAGKRRIRFSCQVISRVVICIN